MNDVIIQKFIFKKIFLLAETEISFYDKLLFINI